MKNTKNLPISNKIRRTQRLLNKMTRQEIYISREFCTYTEIGLEEKAAFIKSMYKKYNV